MITDRMVLERPETWVNTPYLTLSRDETHQYNSGFIKYPKVTKIYLGNLLDVAEGKASYPEETMEYMNVDEMLRDGWRVIG